MEKHCEKCVKENIGCKEIQHLFRDVDKLKASKKFNTFLYIFIAVISVGFVIVSIIVWHNMLKQSISTADLKPEELKNMADLFNSQFSNLLTVLGILLTIFGVAIPIVNAIYQKQTLKDERESLKHEIDISLANIEASEKELEERIETAAEERSEQIATVRSELAKHIDNARKSFNKKQKDLDNKIQEFQKQYICNNGYFFLQLALSNRADVDIHCAYCSYAILHYAMYAESDEHFAQQFSFSVDRLKKLIPGCYNGEGFDSEIIKKNICDAQKNFRQDSIYWHGLQVLINTIEELDKKKAAEKISEPTAEQNEN